MRQPVRGGQLPLLAAAARGPTDAHGRAQRRLRRGAPLGQGRPHQGRRGGASEGPVGSGSRLRPVEGRVPVRKRRRAT
eukprot:424899-Prymnesium_polylepis.1